MPRLVVVTALALCLAACDAEEPLEPLEFAELCGARAPVKLVELEPGQAMSGRLLEIAGRYVYTIGRVGDAPLLVDDEVAWSVGTCGETPRRIGDDIRFVYTDEQRWPGVVFGCHEPTGDLVTLDPTGESPPHVVFAGAGCTRPPPGASALVSLRMEAGDTAALVLHPFPDDPSVETSPSRVLLDAASTPEYPLTARSRLAMAGDLAFVLTTDGTLLRIDMTDGAVAVEQTGVRNFEVSGDARYLLYQDIGLTSADTERTEGVVILRDRATGEGMSLTATDLEYGGSLTTVESGLLYLWLPNGVQRIYFLPALDFVDLPPSLALRWSLPDDRYLLQYGNDGPIHVTDLREAGSTTQIFGDGWLLGVWPEGAVALEVPMLFPWGPGDALDEGPLWLVPLDGQPPTRLADRASRGSRLMGDRRMVTTVDLDGEGFGELMLVDLDTREEQLVERRVATGWMYTRDVVGEDVFYTVLEDEGASVWRARMPPR